MAVLTGSDGAAGLGILSGSGPPSSSLGVVGQPGYIDSTGLVLYGAKTASGWPAGISIAPLKGDKGDVGPASPGLRSGSGLPSTTNPSYQVDGDYYLRTDVSPYLLYGPRASGVFPANGQNTGGSQTQFGSGPPQATTGAQGDVYYDLTNALFWPPRQSGGWTLTPINMVGPTGPAGGTTSYRNSVRGSLWYASAITAGTAYPICTLVSSTSSTSASQAYNLPLQEPMFAAGNLVALTAYASGSAAGVWTINILKNGAIVFTASSFLTVGTAATSAVKVLPTTGLTFAAGDVFTMTASSSTSTGNQSFSANLFYNTNS